MTKEITQEERLDLTDVKEEKEAYTKSIMDALKDKEVEKVVIEKEVKDCILKANCDLMAENERLKKQLNDYEKALKEYAESDNWDLKTLQIDEVKYGWKPALKTLKKWEVK